MTKRMVFNFYFSSSNVGQASCLSTLTNINIASSEELIKVLQISKPLVQKIIQLRDELGEFKEPKDLLKFHELTPLEWQEWKDEGITIRVKH